MASRPTAWVRPTEVSADSGHPRLFCFPHAGAGAQLYRSWVRMLAPEISVLPVQLPGREERIDEPPCSDMQALTETLADGLTPLLREPFALYGHSMGASIAFHLALELRRRGLPSPDRLFLAARSAPHIPASDPPVAETSDEGLVERLARYAGTPQEILDHPELLSLVLARLRSDLALTESAIPFSETPLDVPFTVLAGEHDKTAPMHLTIGWSRYTTAPTDLVLVSGGHFFHIERSRILLKVFRDALVTAQE